MSAVHETVNAMLHAFEDELIRRQEQEQFLFPDEIREILRSCENGTVIVIYDVSEFPEIDSVYSYSVDILADGKHRYLSRHGLRKTETELATELYNFMEDGYMVTINGTNILERWGWK